MTRPLSREVLGKAESERVMEMSEYQNMGLMDRYEALKRKITDRKEPFDRFIAVLEGETTWLTSPASTRFHLSEEQGLLKHSVGVTENLLRFREFLAPAIPEESCVIVGLFHDAGKLGMPGKPLYLPNDNEWLVKNRGYATRSILMWWRWDWLSAASTL